MAKVEWGGGGWQSRAGKEGKAGERMREGWGGGREKNKNTGKRCSEAKASTSDESTKAASSDGAGENRHSG